MGPKLVVITSYHVPELPDTLTLLALKVPDSLPEGCIRGGFEFVRIRLPKINGHYTGTGDFVAACTLAWTHILPDDLPQSLLLTVSAMQSVLLRTGYQPGSKIYCRAFTSTLSGGLTLTVVRNDDVGSSS